MDVAHAGAALWLADWSKDYKALKANKTDTLKFDKYERLGIYTGLGMTQYVFNLFCELSYLIMLMKSAKFLHSNMLSSVLRSNMQWFEATPVGRIINRFSKDIQIIESLLPNSYRMVKLCSVFVNAYFIFKFEFNFKLNQKIIFIEYKFQARFKIV
jgi:ATP-binding cassette subfamily C (CFTR/MRP) protein 1